MMNSILKAFQETIHNLRSNFFQTMLSVLGIIIGVGALVAMLSLIDGLEAFAQDKIASKTSMETVVITNNNYKKVDGIHVKRDSIVRLTNEDRTALLEAMPNEVAGQLTATGSKIFKHPKTDSLLGVRYIASSFPMQEAEELEISFGRMLNAKDENAAVINGQLAMRLLDEGQDTSAVIGTSILIDEQSIEIVGVAKQKNGKPTDNLAAIFPISVLNNIEDAPLPNLILNFGNVEEVQEGKAFIESWVKERFADAAASIAVNSQEFWLEEMRKGFLMFRVVMGLLVGIAVIVGGVGVMNVLLMSINDRTPEIGIRKAVGANRKTILSQFLAESVAISIIGSAFGILLGITVAIIIAPLLSFIQPDLDFSAVLSFRTILTVGVIAVLTGILFGTYPARKAAGMDPVIAIQRN